MPLRPIDAIFVHPKARYYVIYQNGELHKLTRMKLDMASWQRRTPYTGKVEDIYLAKSQNIDDETLQDILSTYTLPATLQGYNLSFFKDWWRMNGYDWLKNRRDTALDSDDAASIASKQDDTNSSDDTVIMLEEASALVEASPNGTQSNTANVPTASTANNPVSNHIAQPPIQSAAATQTLPHPINDSKKVLPNEAIDTKAVTADVVNRDTRTKDANKDNYHKSTDSNDLDNQLEDSIDNPLNKSLNNNDLKQPIAKDTMDNNTNKTVKETNPSANSTQSADNIFDSLLDEFVK